jgi:aminocarboxymuconate-semialdehyde decarboxylase
MTTSTWKRIDADSHFLPQSNFGNVRDLIPGYPEETLDMILRDAAVFADPNARSGGFRASAAGQRTGGGFPEISQGTMASKRSGPIGHGEASDRIKLLPETGFDMQVLIPDGIFANTFGSPLDRPRDPAIQLALCKAFNNATSAAQHEYPNQLIGTAVVPFKAVAESCKEATRAVKELGLKAITISGNWGGQNYDSFELYPFWKTVSELDVPLYVHHNPFACQVNDHIPTTDTIGWERMNRMHISNYLGFAFEYMVGMASLTLGGVLHQFPDLKFCFFEAGGSWLPWLMYTLDRVHHVEPQCSRVPNPPSEYIKRSCMVAVEPDEWCLPQAVASIGSENFMIGSDYPHPPSTYPNTAAGLENMEGLTQEQKENILGRNLMPWMKIS